MEAGRTYVRLEADERRAQILAAARRLFGQRPMSAVSTAAIAREAGITRGLLHHHFGTRRELELAVVQEMLRVPPAPQQADVAGRELREVLDDMFGRWLRSVERDRATWLASVGGAGVGGGDDVAAIVDGAREQTIERFLAVLVAFGHEDTPYLRGVLRAIEGLAEQAAVEWLRRDRLTRDEVQALVLAAVEHLIPDPPERTT